MEYFYSRTKFAQFTLKNCATKNNFQHKKSIICYFNFAMFTCTKYDAICQAEEHDPDQAKFNVTKLVI